MMNPKCQNWYNTKFACHRNSRLQIHKLTQSASLRSLAAAERTAAEITNFIFMRFCVFCVHFECACQLQTGIMFGQEGSFMDRYILEFASSNL